MEASPITTIAIRCTECSHAFEQICDILRKAPADRYPVSESLFQDELGRFRVWLGNVGAHRSGRISLDYRLREAAHVREGVLDLLKDLEDTLLEVIEVVSGERSPYDESLSDSDSSDSGPGEQPVSMMPATELEQTMGDIHDIISSLYEVSLTIRNPAPRDRLLKAASIDVSYCEEWDKKHIEHKFPKADSRLVERLARANCKRRQHFKYLEKHHDKLALGLDRYNSRREAAKPIGESEEREPQKHVVQMGPRSVAGSVPTTIAPKNTQTTVGTFREDDKDVYVEDTLSETSSAASEGVFEATELQIPAPPKSALDGEPFECPYCFDMMKILSLLAWRMHVLRDLQPYSCTFKECTRPYKTYGSRHEWFDHEAQHRKQWSCNYCTQTFSSVSTFSSHLKAGHSTAYAPHQLPALRDLCAKPVDKRSPAQCPLCLKEDQQLRSRLAQHLRTLALFVMPKAVDTKLDDVKSDGVQFGGSEDQEAVDAELDALSDSDRMSNVSEEAMVDVPDLEDHGEDTVLHTQTPHLNANKVEPILQDSGKSLNASSVPSDQCGGDFLEYRPASPHSSTKTNNFPVKPLPAFLKLSDEEIARRFEELEEKDRLRIQNRHLGPNYHNSKQSNSVVQARNRYRNVYPWDNNRAGLEVPTGSCDYMNASPIMLPSSGTSRKGWKYIATQGPTDPGQFWRMIWHETSTTAVIIMLSKTVEYAKSDQYYPLDPDSAPAFYLDKDIGDNFEAILRYSQGPKEVDTRLVLRHMDLSVRPENQSKNLALGSKSVRHYQFEGWADYAVPEGEDREALVRLCKMSRRDDTELDGAPRIVHCGAGSGRTGTFIALDFLLGEIENGVMENRNPQADMIFDVVDALRRQSMLMVQTIELYRFLYHTLRDELAKKLETDACAVEDLMKPYPFYPVMASVTSHASESGVLQFSLRCFMYTGQVYELNRSFHELYDLDQTLVRQAGKYPLGFMGIVEPSWTTSRQREWFDQYVKKLLILPLYHRQPSNFDAIDEFFKPREGDVEVRAQSKSPQETNSDVQEGSQTAKEKRTARDLIDRREHDDEPTGRENELQSYHCPRCGAEFTSAIARNWHVEVGKCSKQDRTIAATKDEEISHSTPTHARVHQSQVATYTLDHFGLPWERDQLEPTYIIIRRWVSEQNQHVLFEHTKLKRAAAAT